MHSVSRKGIQRGVVLGALLLGVSLGYLMLPEKAPNYPFLGGARPVRVAEYRHGNTHGILRVFNVHLDWRSLLGMAEQESPVGAVETGTYHGLLAGTIVVPQMSSGRAELFETPIREITVISGRFVMDKGGIEIPRPSDGTWSGVRVVEFDKPRVLDHARQWLRDNLRLG